MKNFHTHTYRCKHAEGDVDDYIRMAKIKNITDLGFSDHTPLPDAWWLDVRMGMEELEGYVEAVLHGRDKFQDIRILLGLECDYAKEYEWFYKEILEKYPMDYLIGSIHAFAFEGEIVNCFSEKPMDLKKMMAYTSAYINAMESGLFSFMAHPDLFCLSVDRWNKETMAASAEILKAAKDLNMPLEINCSGIAKSMQWGRFDIAYPKREFWELAGHFGVSGIVNTDAHAPKDLLTNMDAGLFLQKEYGIKVYEL